MREFTSFVTLSGFCLFDLDMLNSGMDGQSFSMLLTRRRALPHFLEYCH